MSYNIYNTEGIILSSFDVGESDKLFHIFTKKLGLIQAKAQSIRELKSKNRLGLQDFSITNLSLVRGKDIWRITNNAPKENLFFLFEKDKDKFNSLVKIFHLLKQLIHGEEKNEELFNLLKNVISFLKIQNLKKKELEDFELIAQMRILNNLGYFNENYDKNLFFEFLESDEFDYDLIKKIISIKKQARESIEKALGETHL